MRLYATDSFRLPRARGLTLIEVVAALALLGTLLSAMLIARGRYLRQNVLARESVEAAAVADALLEQWWHSGEGVPLDQAGEIEGRANWSWRTQVVDEKPVDGLDARMVRVSIRRMQPGEPSETLVEVDVLWAIPRAEADESRDGMRRP